jgi:hypothetical protein
MVGEILSYFFEIVLAFGLPFVYNSISLIAIDLQIGLIMINPELIKNGMEKRLWLQKDLAKFAGVANSSVCIALNGRAGARVLSKILSAFQKYPPIENFEQVCLGNVGGSVEARECER